MAVLIAGVVSADGVAVAGRAPYTVVVWGACPKVEGKVVPAELECATVRVPLDYREPMGQTIKLALNRIKAKVPRDGNHLGTLLINPGGPGASGRDLTRFVSSSLPGRLGERYDVVGFDPRGVGGSEPALHCVDQDVYFKPPRPDAMARGRDEERVLLGRAAQFAEQCGNFWSWLLPHLTTENSARDMDMIRAALGEEKISYLGYSYGSYLGAVYATLFPHRVKRLVMDSTVDPTAVWYKANLRQDRSFELRHRQFLAWTARHHDVYKLGATTKQTSFAYYAMRGRLRERPAGGVVGPSELDDAFTTAAYTDRLWPEFARGWSAYVRKGDAQGLLDIYKKHAENDAADENGYAVYLAVQCRDAPWPRRWDEWRTDMTAMHRRAPFLTWPNAWYNAPCAFWPVAGGQPFQVHESKRLPPILIIQSRGDAATPYRGALEMRRHFPRSRMVVDMGGNHGVSMAGNRCIDAHLGAYLTDGSLPPRDATCAALPHPQPAERQAAGGSREHLLGILEHARGR
ncbi:alpha/beta fold hydrolase [Nonomuraea sp. K274]|uniref:Alpha/beta fold hydrolase n=2 Tax=Nonomuraea cypriaca TaxID=1187855 RepID=A0A931AEW8_9ACTN|nr:alpha/beta fold hydrolase [Nonomuraea cypriaca]